jgi:hypothetical protein
MPNFDMRSGYVLYIEHDGAPHYVSIHNSLSGAEAALRDFVEMVLDEADEPIPPDAALVEKLAEFNEYARIYKFRRPDDDDNSVIPASVEIDPFIHPRDSAQAA